MTKSVTIPESYMEISLGQFCDLYELILRDDLKGKNGELTESFWINWIASLTSIPMKDIEEMSWDDYQQLKELCNSFEFKLHTPERQQEEYLLVVDGKRYVLNPDYGYTKMSTARHIEDILGDKDPIAHFDIIATIAFVEVDEQGNPLPFDLRKLDRKRERFRELPMKELYDALFFCTLPAKGYTLLTNRFGSHLLPKTKEILETVMRRETLQRIARSFPNGDSITSGQNSQRITYSE